MYIALGIVTFILGLIISLFVEVKLNKKKPIVYPIKKKIIRQVDKPVKDEIIVVFDYEGYTKDEWESLRDRGIV